MSQPGRKAGNATATIFHPFETGLLAWPAGGARAIVHDPPAGFRAPEGFPIAMRLIQPFRPDFLKLEGAGFAVAPIAEGDGYDLAFVFAGRHRGRNEANIADAWERLRPGGTLLVSGGATDGIDSLRKRVARSSATVEHLSKHHAVVFWLSRGGNAPERIVEPAGGSLVESRFRTAPGMFSHDRVDAGSRLLAENLPRDLSGRVADFGAGWGYLAVAALEHCPGISAIDLFEADWNALEAARKNLSAAHAPAQFHWIDLVSETVERAFDAVIMNPPFHAGRAAEPELGAALVRASARALKPGGRLFLVANRGLPYEKALAESFASHTEILRDGGFKLLSARR